MNAAVSTPNNGITNGDNQTDKDGLTVKVDKNGAKQWSEGSFITEKPKQRSK